MSVTLYNMEETIAILEGEVAMKNIMVQSLRSELDTARRTIMSLIRRIENMELHCDCDDHEPTNDPADH